MLLQREGWPVNHKRIYRIYGDEALLVRTKRRKKRAAQRRLRPLPAIVPGEHWSIDFASDQLSDGRRLRIFTAIDQVSRECVCLEVAQRFPAEAVTYALDEEMLSYGQPKIITSDYGPEFCAKAIREWLDRLSIGPLFIEPGSPWENGYCESFNGKLRDELLNREVFYTLEEARVLIENWRKEYNTIRPHSSLDYRVPAPQTLAWKSVLAVAVGGGLD